MTTARVRPDDVVAPVRRRVRVLVLSDVELVVRGVAAMLSLYPDRVDLVDPDRLGLEQVDLLLLDADGPPSHPPPVDLVRQVTSVALYSWWPIPAIGALPRAARVVGVVPKSSPAGDLVATLERLSQSCPQPAEPGRCGGQGDLGLTPRQREVLALVGQGMTNREIAEALYLTVNTVKTHIRMTYAVIGAVNRSQAVAWVLRNLPELTIARPAR